MIDDAIDDMVDERWCPRRVVKGAAGVISSEDCQFSPARRESSLSSSWMRIFALKPI